MEKLREVNNRHDFQLDNRQIVLMVSGLLLVLMLSFLMGALFGLNLNRMEGGEPALAAAEPAPAPEEALPEEEQEDPMVALLGPGMSAEIIEQGPEQPLDPNPESRQNLIKDLVSQKVPAVAPKDLPDSVADVIAKANAKEAVPPAAPVMAAKPPAKDKSASLGEEDLTKSKAKPAPAPAKPAAKPKAKPAAKPKPAPRPAPVAAGAYTIQLASVPGRVEAEAMVNDLRTKRYDAYMLQVNLPGKGTFYRVRVGRYKDLEQAKKALVIIQSREGRFFDAWITQ